MPGVAEALVDPQGHVDVLRLLHVDADECAEPARDGGDALDVRVRELLVEREAEVRELERDVRLQLLGDESFHDRLVLLCDRGRAGRVGDGLAEQRGVRVEPCVVQPSQHRHAVVERLAGDEAGCADTLAVLLHQPLKAVAVGGVEDRGPRERGQRCRDAGHSARAYRDRRGAS